MFSSKKKTEVMAKEREIFLNGDGDTVPGCVKNGIPEDIANQICLHAQVQRSPGWENWRWLVSSLSTLPFLPFYLYPFFPFLSTLPFILSYPSFYPLNPLSSLSSKNSIQLLINLLLKGKYPKIPEKVEK